MLKTGIFTKVCLMCFLVMLTGDRQIRAAKPYDTPPGLEIIPKPFEMKPGKNDFSVRASTIIVVPDGSEELFKLGRYLSDEIGKLTGFTLEVRTSNGHVYENSIIFYIKNDIDRLGTEGYDMIVGGDRIAIRASKPAGLFYGIQTLRQILMSETEGWRNARVIPGAVIIDKPAYQWRGMSLDCSRHFLSLEFVKRYIDLLAYHKLNVFHWHLTDDQGWRIEIKRYPELTRKGAWRGEGEMRHGGYYTQEQAREIVEYAKSRYITVVPEIEMPGHATAAIAAYPELSCTGESLDVEMIWGIHKNLFCAGKESTFEFLENVLKEVCDVFPSQYIHIGGDEAQKDKWEACPHCQKRIGDEGITDENELQGYFTRRIDTFMQSLGRSIVGWDEILEGEPSKTAVVQSWRGMEGAVEGAKKGHRVISSPASHVYLDFPNIEEGTHDTGWLKVTTLEKVYSFHPAPEELTAGEASLILGGESPLWSERTPQPEIDHMVFPRLCAFSETVWSPVEHKNWTDFSRRMNVHSKRLESLGVDYFTPSIKIGTWETGQVTGSSTVLKRDITKFLKPGHTRFTVRHDRGDDDVTIEWAAISENGREITRDTHTGLSGKRDKAHNYRFRINYIQPDAAYTLKVKLRSDGGSDSQGSFMMRHFDEW